MSEQAPPGKIPRASARRFVIGLSAKKPRLDIAEQRDFLNARFDHGHEPVVVHFHAEFVQKRVELGRLRAGIEQEQNAPLLLPKIAEQFHLAIGEIVLRTVDHDGLELGRNRADIEKIQFLELDVFVLDKCLQHLDRAGRPPPLASRWVAVPRSAVPCGRARTRSCFSCLRPIPSMRW